MPKETTLIQCFAWILGVWLHNHPGDILLKNSNRKHSKYTLFSSEGKRSMHRKSPRGVVQTHQFRLWRYSLMPQNHQS